MRCFSLFVFCALVLIFVSTKSTKNVSSMNKIKSPRENVPLTALVIESEADAFKYLTRFGYNPCESPFGSNSSDPNHPSCQSSLGTMLKQFQTRFQLPETKKLDAATRKKINTPRCGTSDSSPHFLNESVFW